MHFRFLARGQIIIRNCQKTSCRINDIILFNNWPQEITTKPPCNELISNESAPFRCAFLFKTQRQTSRDFNTNAQQQVRREWTTTYTFINPLKTIVNNWWFDLQRRCVCKSRVLLSKCGCIDGSLLNPQRLELQQKHVCRTIIRDREVIVA